MRTINLFLIAVELVIYAYLIFFSPVAAIALMMFTEIVKSYYIDLITEEHVELLP